MEMNQDDQLRRHLLGDELQATEEQMAQSQVREASQHGPHPSEEQLQAFAAGESSEQRAIAEHIDHCDPCHNIVEDYRLLFDQLGRATEQLDPPINDAFAAQVLRRLNGEQP